MNVRIRCVGSLLGGLLSIPSASAQSQNPEHALSRAKRDERVIIVGNPLPAPGKKLPAWFVVTAVQPRWWGSPGYLDELAVVRVRFDNHSGQEINVLNLAFLNSCFVASIANGRQRTISVSLDKGYAPSINSQMIIGAWSSVSFDLEFRHPSKASLGAGAHFRSETTIRFWMRDYLDEGKRQSFEYTIPVSVTDTPRPAR